MPVYTKKKTVRGSSLPKLSASSRGRVLLLQNPKKDQKSIWESSLRKSVQFRLLKRLTEYLE
jgi:hypothetical protein